LRALITGSAGFVGSHLCEYLVQETDWEIWSVCFHSCSTEHLDPIRDRITLFQGDLMDNDWVDQVVASVRPEVVFHLAALSSAASSFVDPARTLSNNILAQVHLFQAILQARVDPIVLVVGSGEEYGMVKPEEIPVNEDTPLRPANPYAVSKVAQDLLALQFFFSHGLRTVRVRPFNHIGPRQAPGFVTVDFARQVAEIEAGQRPALVQVGNLNARRDFTDVRDVVRAYYLAVTQGKPGEVYNIGSGKAHSIEDILQKLVGLIEIPVKVEVDPKRLRPIDVPVIACDCTRFREHTGWEPDIPIEQSLQDILNYWRDRVHAKAP
jgi:GDP-4-dehydro-6-deoxy-D-mannose reductase